MDTEVMPINAEKSTKDVLRGTAIFRSERKFTMPELVVVTGRSRNAVSGALNSMADHGEVRNLGGGYFIKVARHPAHKIMDRQARKRGPAIRVFGERCYQRAGARV